MEKEEEVAVDSQEEVRLRPGEARLRREALLEVAGSVLQSLLVVRLHPIQVHHIQTHRISHRLSILHHLTALRMAGMSTVLQ